MKIFVISLTTAIERRKSITLQFEQIQQEFEFFDAVDGRRENHPLFERYNEEKKLKVIL